MTDDTRMAHLTREHLRALAPDALLVLPIGATEQHGPHLAVGTDHLTAAAVAERTAHVIEDRIPIVVAPVLPIGHSHHHLPFGGTLSVTPATYQQLLVELGSSAAASGFRRLFILNGHGGNVEIAATAAREISRTCGIPVGSGSYWVMAWEQLVAAGATRDAQVPGHAGSFETSLMLELLPELVAEERPSRPGNHGTEGTSFFAAYHAALPRQWQAIDGWSDDPSRATAERGRRYLEIIVEAVAAHLLEFHQRTLAD